jgi:predicted transcriptional regulator
MAMTLRLRPALRARLDAEVEHTGVSLNACIATAIDNYLTFREKQRRSPAAHQRRDHWAELMEAMPDKRPRPRYVPGVNEPCYCQSGQKYKRCCRPKDVAAGHVR